jgi:hypothetical protein
MHYSLIMIKSIPFARRGNLTPDERWLVTLRHVVRDRQPVGRSKLRINIATRVAFDQWMIFKL